MATLPRREIDELVTKYELHPELIDIYVEGDFDRDFVNQFLSAIDTTATASVYSIDAVHVPVELVADLGLGPGSNKNRVIALSATLERELGAACGGVICLVDADLDRVCERIASYPHLRYTDYTCMEMYALSEQSVNKFITFACNLSEQHTKDFLEVAVAILPVQFAARVTSAMLDLGVTVPAASTGFAVKRDFTSFDPNKYFERFVQAGHLFDRREEVRVLFDDVRSKLDKDLRHKAHGHDFVALLFAFSWEHGGIKLHSKDEDVLLFGGRLIASGIDLSSLRNENLFAAIVGLTAHQKVAFDSAHELLS